MKFLAKILALLVGGVFISAVFLSSAPKLDNKEVKKNKEISEAEIAEFQIENVNIPTVFNPQAVPRMNILTTKPNSLEEFKKLIYLKPQILVLVDNAKLKNPFLGVTDKVLLQPVAYTETHIVTTGREVGQHEFKYVAEELWQAIVDSGRKIWVVN